MRPVRICDRCTPARVARKVLFVFATTLVVVAAEPAREAGAQSPSESSEAPSGETQLALPALDAIDVEGQASDDQIQLRIERILAASEWFESPNVRAREGIVFLDGRTDQERYREWAGSVARRTEHVVAVVNRIELTPRSAVDLKLAFEGLANVWRSALRKLPLFMLGLVLVALAYGFGRLTTWTVRTALRRRGHPDLVHDLSARALGLLVFVLGIYVALRVGGLTRLAATILGGTGIAGLVLGIAFRDLAENVLASILLTRQQPFKTGDLARSRASKAMCSA